MIIEKKEIFSYQDTNNNKNNEMSNFFPIVHDLKRKFITTLNGLFLKGG